MRRAGLDLCRVVACLAVVAIHTVMLFWDFDPAAPAWAVWNFLSLAVRFGVPLFFMLSGGLLLERETLDFRRHLRRILHLVLLFYVWSAICCGVDACLLRVWSGEEPLGLLILQGYYHLWFLPALALCQCALPLLHGLLRRDGAKLRRGALLLGGAVLVLAALQSIPAKPAWLEALLRPWPLTNLYYLVYFLLGLLLLKRPLSDRLLAVLGAAALAALLLFAALNRSAAIRAGEAIGVCYGYLTLPAALTACFVFALCLRLERPAAKRAALLRKLAGCTLGVYLLHPLFIDLLRALRFPFAAYSAVWLFPACWLAFVLLPLGATLLLKKVPLIKEILR